MLKLALNAQTTGRPTSILGRARQRSRRPPSCWSGHGRSSRCRPQAVRTRQRIVTEYSSEKRSIFIFKQVRGRESSGPPPHCMAMCGSNFGLGNCSRQTSVLDFGKNGDYDAVPRFHRIRWHPVSDMGIYGIRYRYG